MNNRRKTVNNKILNSNRSLRLNTDVCGIINLGNNCYLNSGLQILASCEKLVDYLNNNLDYTFKNNNIIGYLKDAFDSLLYKKIYDPERFINYFSSLNNGFFRGTQNCSQNFIRTVIKNINDCYIKSFFGSNQYKPSNVLENKEYEKFVKLSKAFPESEAISIFSGMTKSHSYGKCPNCKEIIDDYSFSYFIDQNIYLDEFHKRSQVEFSEVLKANIGNENTLTMDCPKCNKEINVKDEKKYIKLPNILIFTLERYQGQTNKVPIKPDELLDIESYTDKSLKADNYLYELFAINIRFGSTANFGHEICQVKRKDKWYEINDTRGYEIENLSNFDCSYGLFYKKLIPNHKDEKKIDSNQIPKIKDEKKNYETKFDKITPNIRLKNNIDNNRDFFDKNWINSPLQIIASCEELKKKIRTYQVDDKSSLIYLISDIIKKISKNEKLNLEELSYYFKVKIPNFFNDKYDPQIFIEKILTIINKELLPFKSGVIKENKGYNNYQNKIYKKFIQEKEIYPQTDIYSIFSIMTRHSPQGNCQICKRNMILSDSYDNNITLFLYLPPKLKNNKPVKYKFFDVLKSNIDFQKVQGICNYCHKKTKYNEKVKIIKFPEIFIFNLNRFIREDNSVENDVKILPDETLDMSSFIDDNLTIDKSQTRYKLFAVNALKIGGSNTIDYICQIEKEGKWYEIDNNIKKLISKPSYSGNSCGLFYKKN